MTLSTFMTFLTERNVTESGDFLTLAKMEEAVIEM